MNKQSPKQIKKKLAQRKMIVLDVRSEEKFAHNHLKHENADTINVPKQRIFDVAHTDQSIDMPFSKETEVIVTCTTGNSAGKCAEILANQGYRATVLQGGMTAWNQATKTQS